MGLMGLIEGLFNDYKKNHYDNKSKVGKIYTIFSLILIPFVVIYYYSEYSTYASRLDILENRYSGYIEGKLTWEKANEKCISLGMRLPTKSEFGYDRDVAKRWDEEKKLLLDKNDRDYDELFFWVSEFREIYNPVKNEVNNKYNKDIILSTSCDNELFNTICVAWTRCHIK